MMEAKAVQWKRDAVSELKEVLEKQGVIGIVDTAGVPADLFLQMREKLRPQMSLRIIKKTLMKRAWIEAGHEIKILEEVLDSVIQPAIVHTTSLNPFKLFDALDETRDGRAAKPGDVAKEDILVPAQDTGMAPGPIVGELNSIGIPAKIQKGSVHISKTVTAIEAGQTFEGDLGMMLGKLGIRPIQIGIILKGALEQGAWMDANILALDKEVFRNEIISQVSSAFNVACNISWMTNLTAPTIISMAAQKALSVAVDINWINDVSADLILSLTHSRALALATQLDSSALDDELAALLGAAASAAEAAIVTEANAEDTNEEVEEEEEEEEEAGFGGLGDLFG